MRSIEIIYSKRDDTQKEFVSAMMETTSTLFPRVSVTMTEALSPGADHSPEFGATCDNNAALCWTSSQTSSVPSSRLPQLTPSTTTASQPSPTPSTTTFHLSPTPTTTTAPLPSFTPSTTASHPSSTPPSVTSASFPRPTPSTTTASLHPWEYRKTDEHWCNPNPKHTRLIRESSEAVGPIRPHKSPFRQPRLLICVAQSYAGNRNFGEDCLEQAKVMENVQEIEVHYDISHFENKKRRSQAARYQKQRAYIFYNKASKMFPHAKVTIEGVDRRVYREGPDGRGC